MAPRFSRDECFTYDGKREIRHDRGLGPGAIGSSDNRGDRSRDNASDELGGVGPESEGRCAVSRSLVPATVQGDEARAGRQLEVGCRYGLDPAARPGQKAKVAGACDGGVVGRSGRDRSAGL